MTKEKITLGISACLTGDEVRYNAQAAEDKFVNRDLRKYFDYVKVCPEVSIGLGIPRETIRLVKENNEIRLKNRSGEHDYTQRMKEFSYESANQLKEHRLCGFIFKKSSPSCGAFRIKVYNPEGHSLNESSLGVYSAIFQEKFPEIPVEEDGRLNDPAIRHNFIARVFAMKKWQQNVEDNLCIKSLVDFHQNHKYMLMSYSQTGLRELGRIVANHDNESIEVLTQKYLRKFASLTKKPAPRSKHVNVLFHLMGYFSQELDDFDKKEMVNVIEKYRKGLIPLVLPITRVSHYVHKYKIEYLLNQAYLNFPEDLCAFNKM